MVVFDDDHFYLANVLAEKLRQQNVPVTLVTPAPEIAAFTRQTLEQERILARMTELDIEMQTHQNLTAVESGSVVLANVHTGVETRLEAASVVLVTARRPNDSLYRELMGNPGALETAGIRSVTALGDCLAPGAIVHAVYAGHRYARELDVPVEERVFRRDRPLVATEEFLRVSYPS